MAKDDDGAAVEKDAGDNVFREPPAPPGADDAAIRALCERHGCAAFVENFLARRLTLSEVRAIVREILRLVVGPAETAPADPLVGIAAEIAALERLLVARDAPPVEGHPAPAAVGALPPVSFPDDALPALRNLPRGWDDPVLAALTSSALAAILDAEHLGITLAKRELRAMQKRIRDRACRRTQGARKRGANLPGKASATFAERVDATLALTGGDDRLATPMQFLARAFDWQDAADREAIRRLELFLRIARPGFGGTVAQRARKAYRHWKARNDRVTWQDVTILFVVAGNRIRGRTLRQQTKQLRDDAAHRGAPRPSRASKMQRRLQKRRAHASKMQKRPQKRRT